MALFKTREPRKFHHPYIYINERKEKLNVSEDIKKELRAITPHNYTGV